MKLLLALIVLTLSLASFAQGGGDRVGGGLPIPEYASINFSASPLMRRPQHSKVSIYATGQVVRHVTTYVDGKPEYSSIGLTVLSSGLMSDVGRCVALVDAVAFKPAYDPGCMDDGGTYFKGLHGQKAFAVSFCGQIQKVKVPCADELIALLRSLSQK